MSTPVLVSLSKQQVRTPSNRCFVFIDCYVSLLNCAGFYSNSFVFEREGLPGDAYEGRVVLSHRGGRKVSGDLHGSARLSLAGWHHCGGEGRPPAEKHESDRCYFYLL